MKDKNEKVSGDRPEDGKLHINKSVFETSREMHQKAAEEERQRQEELERQLAVRRKRAEEARDKRLEAERLELIRLKQGVIEESETIREEEAVEVVQTVPQKISSFFYLNKWWLGLAAIFTAIVIVLVNSLIFRPRPDIIILMIGENFAMGEESTLSEYVETFTEDVNGNGEILASLYYIPYTGIETKDYANAVQNKLTAEMQSAEGVILFTTEDIAEELGFVDIFTDLTELYPENSHVKGDKFMLSDTDFARKIGLTKDQIPDGWFLCIRKPQNLMSTKKEKMQEVYDRDFPVFDALINDLSN